MHTGPTMDDDAPLAAAPPSPRDAADLLRRARGEEADELTEWALLMLPRSRTALRLRVRPLLADDDAASTEPLLERCVRSLIDAGELDLAEETLHAIPHPSPVLRADMLIAHERWLDAADVLEASLPALTAREEDERLARLLEVLERTGGGAPLDHAMARLTPHLPRSMHRASLIHLARGRFRCALRLAIALARRHPALAGDALPTIVVAASLLQRHRLAAFALDRWSGLDHHPSRQARNRCLMADRWRRGLLGHVIRDQFSARRAGADPSTSILQPLLRRAIATFEDAAAAHIGPPPRSEAARELAHHRRTARRALGLDPDPDRDADHSTRAAA